MMSTYPRVYTHGKDWNWRRNGTTESRRRRIQVRSADSFPWSHGKHIYPERMLGRQPDHENLNDTVTLRGVRCTGAPVYTGPREVSNNPRPVRNGHHHRHWINYQTSASSQIAPPQVDMVNGSKGDSNHVCEGQHVSLRPIMWDGSKTRKKEDNRLITPGRVMAKINYSPPSSLVSEQQIWMGHPQPFLHSNYKESVQNTDRMRMSKMDTTEYNNNERVVPFRTEEIDRPIRYINSVDRRDPDERIPGGEVFNQQDLDDQRKLSQCGPMDFGNPWRQRRHSHNKHIMKANWNRSDNYVGFANTNNHGTNDGSTTNLASEHVSDGAANAQTIKSHSYQTQERHRAGGNNQNKQNSISYSDTFARGNIDIKEADWWWKEPCGLVRRMTQQRVKDINTRDMALEAAVPQILPRIIHSEWPNNGSQMDTEDLLSGPVKDNRGSGRTSISVLQDRPGDNGPQWRKLHTDQTAGNLIKMKTTLSTGTKSVRKTEREEEWSRGTLDPSARCFYPSTVELTMMTDIEPVEKEREEEVVKPKTEDNKEPPMVWNLKGRSVDDILMDLEALKNDPDIPMPMIEADIAPAEDFEQYTRALKDDDCWKMEGI